MNLQRIVVPPALIEVHSDDEDARPWLDSLPDLVTTYLERWVLRVTGPAMHGGASLVLPVTRDDGTHAMLKLQPVTDETADEAVALRLWQDLPVVRVLADDAATGTILLERLDASRPLSALPDEPTATTILAGLVRELTQLQAPPGMRRLGDIAGEMVEVAPDVAGELDDPTDGARVRRWADAVAELVAEPGDRLLHWDLHYDNVLASVDREPWVVIDPKPLAGDPAFELLPALTNRRDDLFATGDPASAIRRRFDLLLDVTGIDRARALGWTQARLLQNALWDIEDEETALDPHQLLVADALGV
ncbi:aminoglycoside phosphotransferase family protein [Kribbella deserti]|uniref:Aminoglycoside phosphotransferase family protein n=1 Tax=Kribbella deserti TaxID=1926257 RepID=A0ABV6QER4_9ACTN